MNTTETQLLLRGLIFALVTVMVLVASVALFGLSFDAPYQGLSLFATVLVVPAFRSFDLFERWNLGKARSIGNSVLVRWLGIVAVTIFLGALIDTKVTVSHTALALWLIVTPCVFLLMHWFCRAGLRRWLPALVKRRRAAIVFVNDSSKALAARLQQTDDYQLLGYFEDRDPARHGGGINGLALLGRSPDVVGYATRGEIDVVFVVLPDDGASRTLRLLEALGDTTVSAYYLPDLLTFNLLKSRVGEIEGFPAIQVAETPFYRVDGLLKQLFDLAFASLVLIAISPILLLIAVLIKLDSPGPVMFLQLRYGLKGAPFRVYKFRTMTVADRSAEIGHVTRDDARVTRVGRILRKTSLDELPQFINVLRGEMSVVGPRPHSVAHNEHYRREVKRYMIRHKVKPGVTGWAQVNGSRGEISEVGGMEKRIALDLEYIREWTPLLDLRIIVMTLLLVFRDKNAY